MRILAIDPGNMETGYAILQLPEFQLIEFGKTENNALLGRFKAPLNVDAVAIEMVASYGMAVGREVFETCVWIGRFTQALQGENIEYIYRREEKLALCHDSKAKDSNIRQALIDRYAKHDFKNGKGVKANPDVFYGVSKDVWQAIAVGVTHFEKQQRA
jgi:hypothetical protein